MHPRIGEIVRLAAGAGLVTGLVTNGALLARRADEVLPHVDRLYVSIDYPGQKHSEMRATSGLWGFGGVLQLGAILPFGLGAAAFATGASADVTAGLFMEF